MKITPIPKYETPYGILEFAPVSNTPGYHYRLAVNGQLTSIWVKNDVKVTRKAVILFIRRWAAIRDGKAEYYYVDNNIDPPIL